MHWPLVWPDRMIRLRAPKTAQTDLLTLNQWVAQRARFLVSHKWLARRGFFDPLIFFARKPLILHQ